MGLCRSKDKYVDRPQHQLNFPIQHIEPKPNLPIPKRNPPPQQRQQPSLPTLISLFNEDANRRKFMQQLRTQSRNIIKISCSETNVEECVFVLFLNKEDPYSSFILQITKEESISLSVRTVAQQLASQFHLNRDIEIQETYYTDHIELAKPISYYLDCQPLYFIFRDTFSLPLGIKSQGTQRDDIIVNLVSDVSGAAIHEKIRVHLMNDDAPYLVSLENDADGTIAIPNQSSFTLGNKIEKFTQGRLVVSNLAPEIKIVINTLRRATTTITCSPDIFIKGLKGEIQKKLHIPVQYQEIVYRNRKLNDYETLVNAGIHDEDNIFIITKLPVNPSEMVLIEGKNKSLRVQPYDDATSPAWRKLLPGLCIEGQCLNKKCSSEGNVIVALGFTMFDIFADREMCKCPVCDSAIKPEKMGFYQCMYTWSCIKSNSMDSIVRYSPQAWKIQYDFNFEFSFPLGEERLPEMTSYKVYTKEINLRQLSQNQITGEFNMACVVCKEYLPLARKEPCGHAHHEECYSKLAEVISSKCLLCSV